MSDELTEGLVDRLEAHGVRAERAKRLLEDDGNELVTDGGEGVPETVTVKVWSGDSSARYRDILDSDPAEYELEISPRDMHYVPHGEHEILAESIEHHGTYAFLVETEAPISLVVETNDRYHSPEEGFRDGRPVEGGLFFAPEGHPRHADEPFKCELWGRVRMRVDAVAAEDDGDELVADGGTDTRDTGSVPQDSTRREIVTHVARTSPVTMDALVTYLADSPNTREDLAIGLHHRDLPALEQQGALVYEHRETRHWEDREIRATAATERIAARIREEDEGDEGESVLIPDGGETFHDEELHIDAEQGLWIPPAFREFDRQVVFRTPRATIQHFGTSTVGPYYDMIRADHFGPAEEFRDPRNPELAPDRLSIKPEGKDATEFVVKLGEDGEGVLIPDGGDAE